MITPSDVARLDAVAENLGLDRTWESVGFAEKAVAACLRQASPILKDAMCRTGEAVASALAQHFGVRFEQVHGPNDIDRLEDVYLRNKRELGFAQLRDEITDPDVDALLFERMNAQPGDRDRWVAVLNLQQSNAKAYWNCFHELAHRIAEPEQRLLPFRRHRVEAQNPVERLIDQIAAELAFYAPFFRPLVWSTSRETGLTFHAVEAIKAAYSPTASLLAVANAVVKHWPKPAMLLTAEIRGRKNLPLKDVALRVTPQAHNRDAEAVGLNVFPNMRVPESSPAYVAFFQHQRCDGHEDLETWTTSAGGSLPRLPVLCSAIKLGSIVYALLSSASDG